MLDVLSGIDALVLAAAELILDNYSYSHFKDLGVDESLLVTEETPEAIAKSITLVSFWFNDTDGDSFELSFSAPWDRSHSFDVEFDGGDALCCAVNGSPGTTYTRNSLEGRTCEQMGNLGRLARVP
ncbi:hypothetical protein RRSWK_04084 [Rhodopirellula sp. SWK7]|nr:hypothetical protein RRSWK_04084 [Rhodopirellula sp. SWK7]